MTSKNIFMPALYLYLHLSAFICGQELF